MEAWRAALQWKSKVWFELMKSERGAAAPITHNKTIQCAASITFLCFYCWLKRCLLPSSKTFSFCIAACLLFGWPASFTLQLKKHSIYFLISIAQFTFIIVHEWTLNNSSFNQINCFLRLNQFPSIIDWLIVELDWAPRAKRAIFSLFLKKEDKPKELAAQRGCLVRHCGSASNNKKNEFH